MSNTDNAVAQAYEKNYQCDTNDPSQSERFAIWRLAWSSARPQIIEELAQQTGVMPEVEQGPWALICDAEEVSEAIAAMQARVDFWKKDSAVAWDKCEERRLETVALQARVEQLEAALGESLFDGYAVLKQVNRNGQVVSSEQVSLVLDAAVKLYRAAMKGASK